MGYALLLLSFACALLLECGGGRGHANSTPAASPRASATAQASPAPDATPPAPAAPDARTPAEPTAMPNKNRWRELEYDINARAEGGRVVVTYRVRNTGRATYLLFNRGDTELGLGRGRVYAEPRPDGTVELGQRYSAEPKDRSCPEREAPVYFGVTVLKPGETVSEELSVALPLKYASPYADCSPAPSIPASAKRVRFCLGAVEAGADAAVSGEKQIRIVKDRQVLARQELLCGDLFELP